MQIIDYIEAVNLKEKCEAEKAKFLCFYHTKETSEVTFSMGQIEVLFESCGFAKPNLSRLKKNLISGKGKTFLIPKSDKGKIELIPATLQAMEKEYGRYWDDTVTIVSSSELIEEAKFCGKRPFLTRLIQQINFCYGNHCYDACAVLMRRLFEVILVLAYQQQDLEASIQRADGSHFMLESIVKNAVQNKDLGIPTRISRNFDSFREVGNNSAHSITYTAGKLDIDNIKTDYRVMLEDLYTRAGLM